MIACTEEVHALYRSFADMLASEEDAEACYLAEYRPKANFGTTVPAIETTLDPVTVGALWAQHCRDSNVHRHLVRTYMPASFDEVGYERVYRP